MKKIYYLICCCIFPLCVSAYDAEINGIYYNLEVSEKMATVTQKYDSESNQSAYYGDVIIPSTIIYNGETYNVKNIGNAAFFNCANVTSVTIPKSIIRIGDAAFANCTGLDAVYISDFDAWCAASISREGGNPLNYANHLYLNGKEVNDVVFPNNISVVGAVFQGYKNLKSITFPNNVTKIAMEAFCGCTGLTSVTISDGLTEIGDFAFSGCKNIESVIVGSGIQIIGDGAFAGIDRLKDFVCWATELPFLRGDRSTFYNTDRTNATLHVPFKSIQKYKRNMYDWGKFKSIIAIEGTQPSHTITYYVDGEVYKTIEVYVEDVVNPEADLVKEGYTFSGWSEIPKTMPDHDVTVTGTFTINKYKLTYMVDGEEYKSYEIKYGSTIIPIDELTKEGYSFSGWSEIPEEMPAHDLTITGTFTKNPLGTCAAPTISIVGDKLTFGCETEGVTYHYKISCSYEKSGEGNSVELQAVYKVTVYASKDDYVNSETVTMEVIGTGTGGILGDLTGDGKVNVADHVKLSDIIMKQSK